MLSFLLGRHLVRFGESCYMMCSISSIQRGKSIEFLGLHGVSELRLDRVASCYWLLSCYSYPRYRFWFQGVVVRGNKGRGRANDSAGRIGPAHTRVPKPTGPYFCSTRNASCPRSKECHRDLPPSKNHLVPCTGTSAPARELSWCAGR